MNLSIFRNAIAYKDMSIRAKRKGMAMGIFIFNLIMLITTLVLLVVYNGHLAEHNFVSSKAFTTALVVLIIIECAIVCFIIPSITAPALANERERQTLDVLLTTNMSYGKIIFGKYVSTLAYVLIILISTLPFLSLSLVYGGVTPLQMLMVFSTVVVTAMYFTAVGIYFSTVSKKSSSASILTLFSLFVLVFGTVIMCVLSNSFANAFNSSNYEAIYSYHTLKPMNADWSFFLLYANPASVVYDALDKIVGMGISNNGSGMDLVILTFGNTLTPSNILIKYWAVFGSVIELALTFLILKLAANKLNPSKRKHNVRKKTTD